MNRRTKGIQHASSFPHEGQLERLYKAYYHGLLDFASAILKSEEAAEDVVQDLFVYLLTSNSQATLTKSYLYTSVRNRAYDVIKGEKVRQTWADEKRQRVTQHEVQVESGETSFQEKELEVRIEQVLNEMPDRRREIFLLSRYHGFTYKEIAVMLDVTVNVVDKQMGKALAAFRTRLQSYFTTLLIAALSVFIFL